MLKPSATVELVWQDASENQAVTLFNLPSSYTVEQAFDAADAVLDACSALTSAALVAIRVRYKNSEEERGIAGGSAPITNTGVFFFSTGPSTPDTGIVVHAVKDAVLVTDGPTAGYGIDVSNSDVLAFADAVLSLPFSNPFGDALAALFAAYMQSRV